MSCEDCTRHDHASNFTQAWPTQTMLRQRGDYTTRRARCAACRQHAAAAASAAAQSCPRCPVDAHGHEDMGFVTKNGRGVIHTEPQSIIYVVTFCLLREKKQPRAWTMSSSRCSSAPSTPAAYRSFAVDFRRSHWWSSSCHAGMQMWDQ